MFGWRLVSEKHHIILTNEEVRLAGELADARQHAVFVELTEAKKKIEQTEKLLEWTQRKYEEALERADRQLDGILAQAGLPEVTATTKREFVERGKAYAEENEKRKVELAEIFAETIGQVEEFDHLGLPDELKAEADKMIAGAKK